MQEEQKWYGLAVLPVYLRLSRKHLKESIEQLDHFEACQRKPHVLNDQVMDRLITGFLAQNHSACVFEEQCKRWSLEPLTKQAAKELTELKANVAVFRENNTQLLALVRDFKNRD